MNVFILNTGRCGSTTFNNACAKITNFSTGHETRSHLLGKERLAYPDQHIEADNRLSWFLGRLDLAYGNDAFYVHLRRDDGKTAESFTKRYEQGIIKAYRDDIHLDYANDKDPLEVSLDYCDTVNTNIAQFLKDKTHKMDFNLEHAESDFRTFWKNIGAEGDLDAALAEWSVPHNATMAVPVTLSSLLLRLKNGIERRLRSRSF
ncbi:MAG: hypothetical protein KA408_14625 [Flavobacteriales bacterium]|nr:hypothetical protein [Flavobacteriales bacterium]